MNKIYKESHVAEIEEEKGKLPIVYLKIYSFSLRRTCVLK